MVTNDSLTIMMTMTFRDQFIDDPLMCIDDGNDGID